jgi:hypothetical protein
VQLLRGEDVRAERLDQRLQEPDRLADVVRQERPVKFDALARINAGLPIERQVIAITRICASSPAPSRPRATGKDGIGACTILSHVRHEMAGRRWRITSKRPGTYSKISLMSSPTFRIVPPQVGHTQAGS